MQNTFPTKQSLWQALKELDVLSSFFSWFFMLLTRLSEPLMLLSTLYIVAETGVPAIALPALHNLSIGIMITAPEVILPGSFVVAARAQKHARLLFAVCWTFVLLTLITLISLFVWHFTGQALAWLMCARCAAAVGYSILIRVMSHGQQVNQVQVVQQQTIEQQLAAMVEQFNTRLQVVQTEVVQQVQTLIQSQVSEQVQASQSTIADQVKAGQSTMLEQVTAQIATAMQEMKRDMRSAIAEATASSSDNSVGSSPTSSPKPARQLRSVTPLTQSELASEPVNVRVPRFIQEQVNQGHKPTLSEIEEACNCSRNTAIRYRREQIGDDEGVA